jgi:surface antigen
MLKLVVSVGLMVGTAMLAASNATGGWARRRVSTKIKKPKSPPVAANLGRIWFRSRLVERLLLGILVTGLLVTGALKELTPAAQIVAESDPNDDYPWKYKAPDSGHDPWGLLYRECVSFVAWRLHDRNHFELPFTFATNAARWGKLAASRYLVDNVPAVGAVGWKEAGLGHVVWVLEVRGDGTLVIEEYNHKPYRYSRRTVPFGDFKFIHFADIVAPVPESPPVVKVVEAPRPPQIVVKKETSNDHSNLQGSSVPVQGSHHDVQTTGHPQNVGGGTIQGSAGGQGGSTATPSSTPQGEPTAHQEPPPPPSHILTVYNKLTNGAGMREDPKPAMLTTQPWKNCSKRGCNIAGTERSTDGQYDAAVCIAHGDRVTNGWDADSRDDANPELEDSTLYYGVRLADGTFGYISEVWITRSQRGGLGLPNC